MSRHKVFCFSLLYKSKKIYRFVTCGLLKVYKAMFQSVHPVCQDELMTETTLRVCIAHAKQELTAKAETCHVLAWAETAHAVVMLCKQNSTVGSDLQPAHVLPLDQMLFELCEVTQISSSQTTHVKQQW